MIVTKPDHYSFEDIDDDKQRGNKSKNKTARKVNNRNLWAFKSGKLGDL